MIRLATACEDFAALRDILSALKALCAQVEDHCRVGIKACSDDLCPSKVEILSKWRQQLYSSVRESITAAFPPKLSKAGQQSWENNMADWLQLLPPDLSLFIDWPLSVDGFQSLQAKLFAADLAHQPFRFIGLPKEMVTKRGIPAKKTIQASSKDAFCCQRASLKAISNWLSGSNCTNSAAYHAVCSLLPGRLICPNCSCCIKRPIKRAAWPRCRPWSWPYAALRSVSNPLF